MAESSLTQKTLPFTSGDTDAEETKTIDDIAIGPSNELAICGHIGVVPKAFINVLDHDFGQNIYFYYKTIQIVHSNPLSCKLIYWRDKKTIVLYVDRSLHYYNIIDGTLLKSTSLNWTPICLCFYKEKLFAASASSKILVDEYSEMKNFKEILLNDLEDDSPSDMVVVNQNVYICTRSKGRALAFTFNGKLCMEFGHKADVNDKAGSICVHERTELVFVSWNATNLKIYSSTSGQMVRSVDVTKVYKLRITEESILVKINSSKDGVSSFDMNPVVNSTTFYQSLKSGWKQNHPKLDEDRHRNEICFTEVTNLYASESSESSAELSKEYGNHVKTSEHNKDLLNMKLKELEDENKKMKQDRKRLNEQFAEESRKLREKEKRISKINSTITSLEDNKSRSKVEMTDLKLLYTNKTEDVWKLEESISTNTTEIHHLQLREQIVDEKTSQLKDILTSNDIRAMSVTNELNTNRIFIASLQLRISSLETEKLTLQDQIKAEKKEAEQYQLSLLKTKKELEQVKQNIEKLREKQELLQGNINRKRQMNRDLKFELSNAKKLIENLQKRTLVVDEIQTVDLERVHRMDHLQEKIIQHETLLKEHGDSLRKEEEYLTERIGANRKSLQTLQKSIRTIDNTYQQRDQHIPGPSRSTQYIAAQIIGNDGGVLELAESNVRIEFPQGALKEPTKIEMRLIPSPLVDWEGCFSSHSTVVVELLPNNLKLLRCAQLKLPHCLLLKSSYPPDSVQVYMSHHKEGDTPVWEHMDTVAYQLAPKHCTIDLHSFCWVKYEIDSTIVEGKRLNLYTAAAKMTIHDNTTQVEVGFYPDLPGYGRILRDNDKIFLGQLKPYVFMKESKEPLEIHFHRIVPRSWMNIAPEDNPKIIPFRSVEISEERSCQFTFEGKEDSGFNIPMCMFNVGQNNNMIELSIRPEVLEE
ncbi:uncharacterized protein [Apostichopus japonicus]|uniref:uncharacterized protein n=1 Tax=Stichopus japonicus TaxID=307972 RepID=UPI003AB7271D